MIKKNFGLLFLTFIQFCSIAQTGIVKGTLTEELNGQQVPLPFANVFLEGTTIGSTSDFDGNFQIKAKAGSYSLMCTFMGYEPFKRVIRILPDSEISVNIEMKPEGIAIEGVKVVARMNRESEVVLIMEQKNSAVAIEAIGAKELSLKGISDAAGAVAKVTGIIKTEGSGALNVRGLGDRYNTTTLNSLPIPSNNPEVKNVDLALFTTGVISHISIEKNYSATLNGDFGGANIDIASKKLNSDDFFSIGIKTGQNSSVFNLNEFLFLDGPSGLGFYSEQIPNTNSIRSQNNYGFKNSWDPLSKSVQPDLGFNLSGGKKLKIGSGNLNSFFTIGFDNEKQHTERTNRIISATGIALTDMNGLEFKYKTQSNAMFNLNYAFGNSEYYFNSVLLNSSEEKNMLLHGNIRDVGEQAFRKRLQFEQNTILINQILGEHELKTNIKLEWGLAYNRIWNTVPDRRQTQFMTYWPATNTGEFDTEPAGANFRYFHKFTDNEYALNIAIHKVFGTNTDEYKHKLSVGYSGRYKKRNFINYQFNHDIDDANIVNVDEVDTYLNNSNYTTQQFKIVIVEPRNKEGVAIDGEEYYGYVATNGIFALHEWNISPKCLLLTGIRAELVNQKITTRANQITGRGTNVKSFNFDKLQVLPSVSLRYAIADKQNIRVAASKTYTLPQLQEMPFMSFTGISEETYGNPYLKPSQVYNADIKWEFFPKGGLFSASMFYKRIIDPINKTTLAGTQNSYFVANTGSWAYVYGVELEAKKVLYSKDAKKLFAAGNLSLMTSKMELDGEKIREETSYNFNAKFNENESALQGAAPILANYSLGYTQLWADENSASAVIVYNYTSERLYAIGQSGRGNEYDGAINSLDIVLKLTIRRIGFGFTAKNLLNSEYNRVQKNRVEENANHIIHNYKKGVSLSFNVKYKF